MIINRTGQYPISISRGATAYPITLYQPGPPTYSYFFQENFEAAGGFENVWTIDGGSTGLLNPSASTSGLSLEGSKCLHIVNAASYALCYSDFASTHDQINVNLQLRVHTGTPSWNWIFSVKNSGGSDVIQMWISPTLQISLTDGVDGPLPADTLTTDTTYYIWFRYVKGTGANAIQEIEFSTTPTRVGSGTKYAITSNSAKTDAIKTITLGNTNANSTFDIYYDRIRCSDSVIGSNP